MKPIYKPKGAAREYVGEDGYALNIYQGCPHRCFYCYCPQVLHKDRETFHSCVNPRKNIVEETRKQLEREKITGKLIHLCFACDPYPTGYDTSVTRKIIQTLKEYGNNVQILTKGDGARDFDLLNKNDWYGITYSGGGSIGEPCARNCEKRIVDLLWAKERGINTWVSFEPVIDTKRVMFVIRVYYSFFDKVKIGKLNYHTSNIEWKQFGEQVEALCKELGLDYYIKSGLRKEMEKL